jgi:hypothetical protein
MKQLSFDIIIFITINNSVSNELSQWLCLWLLSAASVYWWSMYAIWCEWQQCIMYVINKVFMLDCLFLSLKQLSYEVNYEFLF